MRNRIIDEMGMRPGATYCSANPASEEIKVLFESWLQDHDENEIIMSFTPSDEPAWLLVGPNNDYERGRMFCMGFLSALFTIDGDRREW